MTTKTVGHEEWLLADDDPQFVYALNANGINRFSFRVNNDNLTEKSEAIAVARLARASPKLLAASQLLSQLEFSAGAKDSGRAFAAWRESHGFGDVTYAHCFRHVMGEIRAAIAEATGETP